MTLELPRLRLRRGEVANAFADGARVGKLKIHCRNGVPPPAQAPDRLCHTSAVTRLRTHTGSSLELRKLVHRGNVFETYEARTDHGNVAVKLARTSPTGILVATWSFLFSRLISSISNSGRIFEQGRTADVASLAPSLLNAEAEAIATSHGGWNHDAICDCVDWPGRGENPILVSTWRDGDRLSDLPHAEQRRIFPRMLPSLWRAIACALHGDVTPSNIIVWPHRDRFSLIDPGVFVRESLETDDVWPMTRVHFVTSPSAYPIIPPYLPTMLPPGDGAPLSAWFTEMLRGMGEASHRWRAGERTIGEAFTVKQFPASMERKRTTPHPADLLALGVLYYEILTRTHPLYEGSFSKPAWMDLFVGDGRCINGSTVDHVFARLARPIAPPSARNPEIHPAEDELALALVELRIASLEQLTGLADEAAQSN